MLQNARFNAFTVPELLKGKNTPTQIRVKNKYTKIFGQGIINSGPCM